jgi:hypothetical protein
VKRNAMKARMVSAVLAATLIAVTLAPAARADGVRYRGHDRGHRTVVIERHDGVGPALFGFIGGLVLGSVVTHASQQYDRPVSADYEYYDPWCDRDFASFGAYDRHLDRADHPARLMVMDRRYGSCVARYENVDGRWMRVRDGDRYGRDGRSVDDRSYGRDDDRWRAGDDCWDGGYRRGEVRDRDDHAYRDDDRGARDDGAYRPNDGRGDEDGDGGN